MKKLICIAAALGLVFCAACAQAEALLRNGGSFVLVVREDGKIVGWGDNRRGQLGTTPTKLLLSPQYAADGIDGNSLRDIQCGNENTLFLTESGEVYTCGTYSYGTQGIGKNQKNISEPVKIPGLENIVGISCGFGHNAALDAEGHLWVWGRNDQGQLGLGDKTNRTEPAMLEMENITQVNCGGKFILAMDADGNMWGWGANTYRVLEDSKKSTITTPVQLTGFDGLKIVAFSGGSDVAYWLDSEGTLWSRGRNEFNQVGSAEAKGDTIAVLTKVDIPEKVKQVCAYSGATGALTENGNVYIWGNIRAGQAGLGTVLSSKTGPVLAWDQGDAVEVAMGSLISSIRTEDGAIYVSGYNKYGQIGNGTTRTIKTWTANGTNVNDTDDPTKE